MSLYGTLLTAASVLVSTEAMPREEMKPRVAQIFIVGNTRTRQDVILRHLDLHPGQTFTYPELRLAERNLARLGRFTVDAEKGIRPTVTLLDPDAAGQFKDLLVQVAEKPRSLYSNALWDLGKPFLYILPEWAVWPLELLLDSIP